MNGVRLVILVLVAAVSSCSKRDLDAGMTACMREEIETFKTSDRICDDAVVTKYFFQNQYVYVFDAACCCDWISSVVDADCNVIGGLGGIAGNTKVNGADFRNAKLIGEVWRNPRSEISD